MEKVGPINFKELSYDKTQFNSRLELNLNGKDIDHIIVNTIRRVILSDIPIYIYNKFDFTENTSIFNNNYIKLRIRNIPVIGIQSDTPFYNINKSDKEEDNYIENIMNIDDVNLKNEYELNETNLKQLTLYLDYTNKTNNIISIGTDNCKFYYKEKEIGSPYKTNIPIIKLQEGQSIKFSAITELGTESMDALYSPVSVLYFTKNDNDNYNLYIESRGQIEEYNIIKFCIQNILKQIDKLKIDIMDKEILDIKEGVIELEDYDHTMGNLLSHGLRKHKSVLFGGYNMPHLLDNLIKIHFKIKENNIKNILIQVIEYYHQVFTKIFSLLN